MRPSRPVVVTPRDRQLLAVLAQARCLSTEQLRRLFFPHHLKSRHNTAERRLRALSGMKPALLERMRWNNVAGWHTVWSLAPYGVELAERELDVDLGGLELNVSLDYIEHHLLLSELFVGLLELGLKAKPPPSGTLSPKERQRTLPGHFVRAHHLPYTWLVRGDLSQPWKQPENGKLRERLIRPDAILELPQLRQRIFVEAERGTHSVAASSGRKPGATSAKMERYSAFCDGLATVQPRRTWYQAKHADGFAPRVLFLVESARRRANVEEAIAAHMRKGQTSCSFRAATISEAVLELGGLIGQLPPAALEPRTSAAKPPPADALLLSAADYKAFRGFYEAVLTHFKTARAKAREQKLPEPAYPSRTEDVHQLIRRLAAAAA